MGTRAWLGIADSVQTGVIGTENGIPAPTEMKERLATMSGMGIPTEFHSYDGLQHGFGLGTGTVAEGWINDAVAFWEGQM